MKSNIFFTSDLHFSHQLTIDIRGFNTPDEMNDKIISNWNKKVTNNDIVYFLGDLTLKLKKNELTNLINKLNGKRFYIVLGNHDKIKNIPDDFNILERIHCMKIDGINIVLCHFAMLVWPKSHFGSWHLYGHSHNNLKADFLGKAMDVGIDCNNLYPYSWEEIKEKMLTKPKNFNQIKD